MRTKLWNGWEIVEKIGEGRTGDVYKAVKKFDNMLLYCAIKYIRLPKKIDEVKLLVKEGIINDESEAIKYYSSVLDEIKKEIAIMQKFNGNKNIIDCFDYFQEATADGAGFDFYLRMELASDVTNYFNNKKDVTQDVIKLGIDICSALEFLCKEKIIHKDIKPNNIFFGSDGSFKLSDFGIASNLGKNYQDVSGTYSYMPPEVFNKQPLTSSTDLYSLGLVMYYLLNNNTLPFVSKFVNDDMAFKMRMSGVGVPSIKRVDKNLMSVIIKACSFNPSNRYSNPSEMKTDLESILNGTGMVSQPVKIATTLPSAVLDLMHKKNTVGDANILQSGVEKTVSIYDTRNGKTSGNVLPPSGEKTVSIYDTKKIVVGNTDNNVKQNGLDGIATSTKVNSNSLNSKSAEYSNLNESIDAAKANTNKREDLSEKFDVIRNLCEANKGKIAFVLGVIVIILFLKGCVFSEKVCKAGHVNSFGVCVKGWYTCPNGYELNKKNKCSKTLKSIDANVKYSCDGGYLLQDKLCIKNDTKEPVSGYQCAGLGTLKGDKCVQEQSADAASTFACPSGYIYYDGKCATASSQNATATYTCPSGYNLSGSTCTKTESIAPTTSAGSYKCDINQTMVGNRCRVNASCTTTGGNNNAMSQICKWNPYYPGCQSTQGTRVCTCPSGYSKEGEFCYKSATYVSGKQSCSKGALSGGRCVYTDTKQATVRYTCPGGYDVYGNQCVRTSTVKPTQKYYCPNGTTLRGNQCVTSISVDAIMGYSCEEGYILAGTSCVLNDQKDAVEEYSCSKVYTLNGSKCEKYDLKRATIHYGEKKDNK